MYVDWLRRVELLLLYLHGYGFQSLEMSGCGFQGSRLARLRGR